LYHHIVNFTPYDRLVKLIDDFYGLKISPATIAKFISTSSKSLDSYENEDRNELLKSPILHVDETGFRVCGKRWWLHSMSTSSLTYYAVHQKRGKEAIDEIGVIPPYKGVLVHDFWAAYCKYPCMHAYCNAHITRELQGVYEGYKQKWAKETKELLKEIYRYIFEEGRWVECKIQEFGERYEKLILKGKLANPPPEREEGQRGRLKDTKGGNLARKMEKHKDGILLFAYTGGYVPYTNNQAEQDVRMMKRQQKSSGTFRSEDGAKHFAKLRGYTSTMRKQGQSIFQAMKALAVGRPTLLSSLWAE
jgi:transposase